MKTISVESYRDKIWTKYVSPYIRLRDADWRGYVKCCTCSTTKHWKEMHAGHYKHGKARLSYLEETNIHAQCSGCNMYKNGDLAKYAIFLEERYGYGILQKIQKLADDKQQWNKGLLREREEYYKSKLKEYDDRRN